MKSIRIGCAAAVAFCMLALNAGSAAAATAPAWGGHYQQQNLAGQYSGTVTDSVLGTGTATANLASSFSGLGGNLGFTFASTTYNNPTSASNGWGWGWGGGVRGVFIAVIASASCTFFYNASYNSSSFVLSGNYQAINGCSGETGSFSLTQSCYYSEYNNNHQNRMQNGQRRGQGSGLQPCT
ncbi:MAG TPA: hypothetical protein VFF63_04750 [Candidatus Babeliales bacterium]|nr:hypothetical protein [Candidatus Babeliales bacterium]